MVIGAMIVSAIETAIKILVGNAPRAALPSKVPNYHHGHGQHDHNYRPQRYRCVRYRRRKLVNCDKNSA